MSILLENYSHPYPGPLESFFDFVDSENRGSITARDLRPLVDQCCLFYSLSFVHKKILCLMLSQGFSRYVSNGRLFWSDAISYTPKLFSIFCSTLDQTKTNREQAQKRFQEIQNESHTVTLEDLSRYCMSRLPPLCPNKKLLSQFLAYSISLLCSSTSRAEPEEQISEQMWCDTALALQFEVEANT